VRLSVIVFVCVSELYITGIQFYTNAAEGDDDDEDSKADTTVVFKGKAPVDSACKQKLSKVHYYRNMSLSN